MMMRHNRDVRGKNKRSFRDKQVGACSFRYLYLVESHNSKKGVCPLGIGSATASYAVSPMEGFLALLVPTNTLLILCHGFVLRFRGICTRCENSVPCILSLAQTNKDLGCTPWPLNPWSNATDSEPRKACEAV